MSLIIIKCDIPETFRGVVSEEVTNAKKFLTEIEKRFVKSDKGVNKHPFAYLNFQKV